MVTMQALEALLSYVNEGSRVCPMPVQWDELWQSLPDRRRVGNGWEPAAPLILAGWWASTNDDKRERLAYHIRWAFEHGAFEAADRFLRMLPTEHWHHSDRSKPNF